jgi:hypothetical protein
VQKKLYDNLKGGIRVYVKSHISTALIFGLIMVSICPSGLAKATKKKSRPAIKAESPRNNHSRFSYQKVAVGMGIDLPDFMPIELLWWSHYFGARIFYAPAFKFPITIEMPDDIISTKNNIIVEHSALNIKLDAKYGANWGAEFSYYPFAGSFFVGTGISFRQFHLEGGAQAPLSLRPVGSQEQITTLTEFGVRTNTVTKAFLLRLSAGWIWRIFDNFYSKLTVIGLATPYLPHNNIEADVIVSSPTTSDPFEVSEALAELKENKESELRAKAKEQIGPAETQIWPIIGLSFGIVF